MNPAEVQLIRSRLEAAGLNPQVDREFDPLCIEGFARASGGIQVQVPSAQAEEARSILAAGEHGED